MGWVPGWEFETGLRYWCSIGRSRLNLGVLESNPDPIDTLVSRLAYENLHTHTGEFFARIDSPYSLFAKGFVGGGAISSGNMRDEDWALFSNTGSGFVPPPFSVYSNTNSPLVTGNATYGTVDVGYDWLRGPTFKSGVFVGYNYFYEKMKAFGCVQTARPVVNVTANFSVGVGGRYWAMWTTSGQANFTCCNESGLPATTPPQHFKFATEQAGLLLQASYKPGATAYNERICSPKWHEREVVGFAQRDRT
jgi:hypothetical protein